MKPAELLLNRFYSAFQQLDYKTMQDCYSDDVLFSDPVFGLLKGDEAKAMWEMLCKNAQDFSLLFSDIEVLDDEYATCKWIATYTFSKTGNKVMNSIKAFVRIHNGKIIEHSDAFRLSTWIGQALGWKGILFGWTNFMKRAVQKQARKSLDIFMQKQRPTS
ncbi:MAG: nuclear transport factor 2 family protein [Bacteroidota bacterium]